MTVEVHSDRKAQVLKWEPGDYEGPVTLNTEAPGGDVSSTNLVSNAGYAAVSFPLAYSGEYHATVVDDEGATIDEGDIEVA